MHDVADLDPCLQLAAMRSVRAVPREAGMYMWGGVQGCPHECARECVGGCGPCRVGLKAAFFDYVWVADKWVAPLLFTVTEAGRDRPLNTQRPTC